MDKRLVNEALTYARSGYPVFPCRPDKSPYVKGGFKSATADQQQIQQWWDKWPEAMIGLRTGVESGLWVLDVDFDSERGIDGYKVLDELLQQYGLLPATWTEETPRGGRHYYFKYPQTSEPIKYNKDIGPGLDIKSDGGYIIVAPSTRSDGKAYRTINGPELLAEAPDWLLDLAVKPDSPKKEAPQNTTNEGPTVNASNDSEQHYIDKIVRDELEKVNVALAGERNNALNKAAYSLGRLVGGGCVDRNAVVAMLFSSAKTCGLGYEESIATIESGLTAGASRPRMIDLPTPPPGFRLTDKGLFSIIVDAQGNEYEQWLADPIMILGLVRDTANEEWGLLVRWKDPNGVKHTATIQKAALVKDDKVWLLSLVSGGWGCSPHSKHKNKLTEFFALYKTNRYLRSVKSTGWHDGQFVLPDRVLNGSAEPDESDICLMSSAPISTVYSSRGTLAEWQQTIGKWAEGNSRLELAICAGLAAPLLEISGMESGGFNFVGGSSIGKTTALFVAASVWGKGSTDSGFLKTWRSTSNGLEGCAATHNDALLCLDELGQASGKTVAEAAYMLANGQGKSRADRSGNARAAKIWRILVLSTGELGLADKINADGGRSQVGQEVRLIDVPADAGCEYGIFENIHGFNKAHEFAEALKTAAASNFGVLAPAFINSVIDQRTKDEPELKRVACSRLNKLQQGLCGELGRVDGQVQRVAERFALCGLAGLLAIRSRVLLWDPKTMINNIKKCFLAWLDHRGTTGALEEIKIIRQVKLYIEQHGDSRFQSPSPSDSTVKTHNRAGFKFFDPAANRLEYYVLPEVFKAEVCKGFDYRFACRVLLEAGYLIKKENDRMTSRPPKSPNGESIRGCYLLCTGSADTEVTSGSEVTPSATGVF